MLKNTIEKRFPFLPRSSMMCLWHLSWGCRNKRLCLCFLKLLYGMEVVRESPNFQISVKFATEKQKTKTGGIV